MHQTVYAAWALALCVSSAHAFMPSSAVPTRASVSLRPACSPLAKRLHAPGCSCATCLPCPRASGATLTMAFDRGADDGSFRGEGMDSATYAESLNELFPGAVDEAKFIETMGRVAQSEGFNPKSAINLVSTCRDEICRPFTEKLDAAWAQHFNIASLGGMVFCGKTGFGAGMAHSPQVGGKERYVFWVGPHIAFGTGGSVGQIWRPGREGISSACGALIALNGEIDRAKMNVGLDPVDTEMSLLRQQVMGKLTYGQKPNLVGITYAAHDCILDQVTMTAEVAANKATSEYIIISGIQVHGALGQNFWWPGSITKYANGVATDLSAKYDAAIEEQGYDVASFINSQALSHAQTSAGMRLPGFASGSV